MDKKTTELLYKSIDKNNKPKLLLHACCGPCTSGVFEQLYPYFNITILYYNPNTYPYDEYILRYKQLEILKDYLDFDMIFMEYNDREFYDEIKGLELEKEGGKRCEVCYKIRMNKTAEIAKLMGFDYFTTTLSVSPYKNAQKLNMIGEEMEKKYNVNYIYSDFKKNEGYKNSIKNSKEYGLYRQDYCGCEYSLRDRKQH